ncbi:hypothetical protein [Pandoraea pnomenusa]|uniref:hypothetical protein n=1 Tax=Pandoraea pnomenusa TaxID=93220 RepID=UPI00334014F2
MATRKSTKALGSMTASGFGIIQVAGDLSITQVLHANGPAAPMLSREERSKLSSLTEEVVLAESGIVSTRLVRASLNTHLNVGGVDGMTAEMFPRASLYLTGWKNCAAGQELSVEAMVAQVMRIWTIVPQLKATTLEFTRSHFSRDVLKTLSVWELRATLAYTMARWNTYWEARNA